MPRVRIIAFLLILGAVFGDRIVTINNGTISSNIAGGFFNRTSGGGVYIDGGTATVSNSTLSGNRASSFGTGGGIANDGTLTINNSTISGNSAFRQGGGISGATATLQNSIVASNLSGNCNGAVSSNGYNLSSDGTCTFNGPGDLNKTNPQVGTFGYYGGANRDHPSALWKPSD